MSFAASVEKHGRAWGLEQADSLHFAFRRRYSLAPTDPRFTEMTEAGIIVDLWAHRFADDPKLREEVVAEEYDDDVQRMVAEAEAREASEAAAREALGPDQAPGEWDAVASETFGSAP